MKLLYYKRLKTENNYLSIPKTDDKRALDDSCHTLDSLFRGDYYDVPFINHVPKVGETTANNTSGNNIGGGDSATGGADATAVTNNNDQKESGSTVPKEVSQEDNEETKVAGNEHGLNDACHTLDSLF